MLHKLLVSFWHGSEQAIVHHVELEVSNVGEMRPDPTGYAWLDQSQSLRRGGHLIWNLLGYDYNTHSDNCVRKGRAILEGTKQTPDLTAIAVDFRILSNARQAGFGIQTVLRCIAEFYADLGEVQDIFPWQMIENVLDYLWR